MAKDRHVDDASKAMNRGGRPAALTPQHILLLREIVSRMPHATLDELAGELDHTGQVRVCTATIRRTLRAQGIVRSMPTRETRRSNEPEAKAALSKRYGYTAAIDARQVRTTAQPDRCRMGAGGRPLRASARWPRCTGTL